MSLPDSQVLPSPAAQDLLSPDDTSGDRHGDASGDASGDTPGGMADAGPVAGSTADAPVAPPVEPPSPTGDPADPPGQHGQNGQPDTQQRQIYGLVDVGGRLLAIQAVHVREAVPYPTDISPMAVSLPGLMGAMVLRQDTIPLVDMAVMLGLSSDLPMSERVVIIVNDASQQRLLGLVVDRLQGMTSLKTGSTAEMRVVGHDHLLAGARSFVHDGTVVGLLDPQLLFDQPRLPYAIQRDRKTGRNTSMMFSDQQAYLLCDYSGQGIAFPVRDIHATIPLHTLRKSPLAHGPCDGVIEHHGSDIPILDTLQMMGLGCNATRPERSAAVAMRVPSGGLIAFEIDRFFDIVHTRPENLLEMPPVLTRRGDLFAGIHMTATGDHYLVLRADRALSEEVVIQLASTTVKDAQDTTGRETGPDGDRDNTPDNTPDSNHDSGQTTGQTTGQATGQASPPDTPGPATGALPGGDSALYLVSQSAGKRMAILLTDIVEIMRLPDHLLNAEVRHDSYMGTLSHRAQLVPLFSVGHLLGKAPAHDAGKACVLLFRMGQQLYGATIEALEAVTRCHPIGTPEDRVLRQLDSGGLLPVFDLTRDLPVDGGGSGLSGGFSEDFSGDFSGDDDDALF